MFKLTYSLADETNILKTIKGFCFTYYNSRLIGTRVDKKGSILILPFYFRDKFLLKRKVDEILSSGVPIDNIIRGEKFEFIIPRVSDQLTLVYRPILPYSKIVDDNDTVTLLLTPILARSEIKFLQSVVGDISSDEILSYFAVETASLLTSQDIRGFNIDHSAVNILNFAVKTA